MVNTGLRWEKWKKSQREAIIKGEENESRAKTPPSRDFLKR